MKKTATAANGPNLNVNQLTREAATGSLAFFFFLSYLLLVIIRPHEFGATGFSFPIIPIVEVLTALAWLGIEKRLDKHAYAFLFLFSLAIFLSLITHSMAIAIGQTIEFLSTIVFVTVVMPAVINNIDRAKTTLKLIAFCSLVISIHTLDQQFSADRTGFTGQTSLYRQDSGGVWQVRYIGIFGDPNDLGLLLVAMMPIALWFRSNSETFIARRYYEIIVVMTTMAIFFTNSRGTWLALAAIASLWIALKSGVTRVAVFLGLAVPAVLAFGPSRLSQGQDQSSSERIDAWYQGFQMFQNYPILGVGKDLFRDHHEKTAHNSWILALAETGLFGYLAWSGFMFFCLSSGGTFAYKSKIVENFKTESTLNQLLVVAFFSNVAILVSMMFLSRAYTLTPFMFCGLFLALREIAKRETDPVSLRGSLKVTFIAAFSMIIVIYIAIRIFGV